MTQEITQNEALERLGTSTAEAIEQVLSMFAPGAVERGEVSVVPDGTSPFASLPSGTLATSVSYVDGVTGANVFALTPAGARSLAAAMGVSAPDAEAAGGELTELEQSAVAEAANQMMAAAAAAIGGVLGQAIEISPPDTRVLENPAAAAESFGSAPHAIATTFLIGGESCQLIQLVPKAFVLRMARAIDDMTGERALRQGAQRAAGSGDGHEDGDDTTGLREALGGIRLRVWAELGRARMPLGKALGLPLGAVVELDRGAEAPVDVYVNGLCFARGRLVVRDGEWAVSLDELFTPGILAQLAAEDSGLDANDQGHEPGTTELEPELEGALT